MNHTMARATRTYILTIACCFVVIAAGRLVLRRVVYAPLVTLAVTIVVLMAILLILIMSVIFHAMRREARDWARTCDPILARYEIDADADALIASYEAWRLEQHTSVTRFDFLEQICRALARDGYVADTRVALSLLADMARTPALCRRFEHLRSDCGKALSRTAGDREYA